MFGKREENPFRESVEIIIIGFIAFLALVWFEVSTLESTRTLWFVALLYEYGGKWLVGGVLWALGLWGVSQSATGARSGITTVLTLAGIVSLFLFQAPLAGFIQGLQGKDGMPKIVEQASGEPPKVAEPPKANDISYRIFTDKNGREIEALLTGFDGRNVHIRRKDGAVFTTDISIYSPTDQDYIRKHAPQK